MPRRRKFSNQPLGDTVQRLMAENGHTYRGLADATGLSAGYLNHIVHGNRPVPSNEVVERLAKALGVDAAHFREYRLRVVVDELEKSPELIDRLYKRYG
jgi:transcriptional regulator with XRE-family HTH domain